MYSFLQKQRIRSHAEINKIIRQGHRFSKSPFSVCCLQNEFKFARLGLLIGKKYCRLAAKRNRIKRLIREYFRLNQKILLSKDIVVMLRSSTQNINDQEKMACIATLFSECANVVLH